MVARGPSQRSSSSESTKYGPSSLDVPRDYLHIELEIDSVTLNYQTGDHIAIWPIDNEREADNMCRSFGWDNAIRQASIDISPNEEDDEISLHVRFLPRLHE